MVHQPGHAELYPLLFAAVGGLLFLWTLWTTGHRPSAPMNFAPPTPSHFFKSDGGLLEMNSTPKLQHPISFLIERAERLWEEKLQRQSRTLSDAHQEYIRRYKRKPPVGFDVFYWCQKHQVQLVDEFDQLHSDLETFWGVDPKELVALQPEVESARATFTIGKTRKDSNIEVVAYNMTEQQMKPGMASAEKQIHALDEVAQYLPPFRATWTIHDGPGAFASWEMKDAARKAAAAGTYVDGSRIKTDAEGFAAACPPHSPIRHANYSVPVHFDVAEYQHVFPKSFIADLHASLDICSAPDLIPLSPLGSRPGPGPSPDRTLFARFARSKTLLHPDILGVPLVEMNESQDDIPWANKTDQRMLWRGRTTGGRWAKAPWDIQRSSARLRFVALTGLKNGTVPVLLPPHNDTSDFEVRDIELSELNQLFDVGIIDTVQCDPEICERIKQTHNVKEPIFPDKGKHYKYIFDVDGNAWSSRFRRLMTRNSLLFKSTVFPEWWTDRVMPWVHFVPVKVDYSDLYDALVFFRGLPDGSVAGQDQLGERIAMAGRDWVERFWRHEDITAYTWRMYMEFARVTSTNRTSLDFIMPDQAHP